MTIAKLRKAGFQVRVTHVRRYTAYAYRETEDKGAGLPLSSEWELEATGGRTVVEILILTVDGAIKRWAIGMRKTREK